MTIDIQKSRTTSGNMIAQIAVLIAAVTIAWGIIRNPDGPTSDDDKNVGSSFDMLEYLDNRVAVQEDGKDVRCWSSVCKVQMFLAGAPIEPDARSERVSHYMNLLNSFWQESLKRSGKSRFISAEMVSELLAERFPYEWEENKGRAFDVEGLESVIKIGDDDITDYSDTVESWRILQTWVSRSIDANGKSTLVPGFSQDALDELADFLRVYDIALLRYARELAVEERKASIDSAVMSRAFSLEKHLKKKI